MTTRIAILLILVIAGFFVLDHYVLHLDAAVTLAKKGIEVINMLAIWR